jgi:hypothetical protein
MNVIVNQQTHLTSCDHPRGDDRDPPGAAREERVGTSAAGAGTYVKTA